MSLKRLVGISVACIPEKIAGRLTAFRDYRSID